MNVEEIHRQIGENIRLLRTYYGMSRKTPAMLIKMPVNRLRRVEAGDPTAKIYDFHLHRVARVFDVTIDALTEELELPRGSDWAV